MSELVREYGPNGWQTGAPDGGALPDWIQFGNGSPKDVVKPFQVGALYVDTSAEQVAPQSGLYIAMGSNASDGWFAVGGDCDPFVEGYHITGTGDMAIVCHDTARSFLTDILAYLGSGNGVYWTNTAVDGEQTLNVLVGSGGLGFQVGPGVGTVKLPGLPTADPHVADQLWNSSGTLKVSAG